MAREIGDIENDLGFVTGQIEDLTDQLYGLQRDKESLLLELEKVDTWQEPVPNRTRSRSR